MELKIGPRGDLKAKRGVVSRIEFGLYGGPMSSGIDIGGLVGAIVLWWVLGSDGHRVHPLWREIRAEERGEKKVSRRSKLLFLFISIFFVN